MMMKIFRALLEILQGLWLIVGGSYLTLKRIIFPSSPESLRDEVILVTGGSSGIGQGILYTIAKLESNVTLISWDVNEGSNEATIKRIQSLGVKRFKAMTVDVTNRSQVAIAAAKVRQEFGDVTMIFNNAGITGPVGKCWETDVDDALKTFDVNLFSHWYTIREFLPAMIRNNRGHIIPTCSVAGFMYGKYGAPYIGSKHAMLGYYNCLKEDLRVSNSCVNVSIVYPGHVHTNMTANFNFSSKAFPVLSSAISALSASQQIVESVLHNQENIYVPSPARFVHLLSSWITPEIYRSVADMVDIHPILPNTARTLE